MPSYKVVNKHIYYASTMDVDMGLDDRGEPRIVRQMGPTERVEVGTILEDVPAHVLAAFPDRFVLVAESPPVPSVAGGAAQAQPPEPAPPLSIAAEEAVEARSMRMPETPAPEEGQGAAGGTATRRHR